VIFRWINSLAGRVALFVFLALLAAQVVAILGFVDRNQRDRANDVSNQFFRQVSGLVQLYNNVSAVDRQKYIRTVGGPGLHYWTTSQASVTPDETAVKRDQLPTPREWNAIQSPDKRVSWYEDIRPLSMRYDISPNPSTRTPPEDMERIRQEEARLGVRGGTLPDAERPPPPPPPPDAPPRDRAGTAGAPDDPQFLTGPLGWRPGDPPPERRPQGLGPSFGRNDMGPEGMGPGGIGPRDMALEGRLSGQVWDTQPPEVARILGEAYGPAAPRATDIRRADPTNVPPVRWRVSIQLDNGEWLNAEHFYERGLPPWLETVLLQSGVTFAIMMLFVVPAVAFATKPLRALARASDKLGRGEDTEALPEKGTSEIVQLTQAFNGMSHRLRRFVQGRTEMLAGISHDLRTPITALKLRTELVDDDENRERMLKIIDEMHHLTEATLLLARDDSFTEKSDLVDLSSLIEGICDDLTDAGIDCTAHVERGVNLTCRPYSLRRAIRNLAENGAKYGHRSRIHLEQDASNISIIIDDDGPGIPEDQMARAFKPFVRLEGSRSRETGGAGLGLAITRGVILNHGGEIKLSNRPVTATDNGGLRATITLPKAHLF
jgi:signal transduction histidine kinase